LFAQKDEVPFTFAYSIIDVKMSKNPVSLKDFAAQLGVSVSTVSRALKNHPDISDELKHKVQELAKQWNYIVAPASIGFHNPSTKTIGVVIPNMVRFFYSSILSGIESFARDKGYFIVITNSNESYENEVACIDNLLRLKVDGLIVCLSHNTQKYSHFDNARQKNVPLVFFDRVCRTSEFSSVIADNAEAAKNIVDHLKSGGSRRIAHITGPKNLNVTKERMAGYLMGLNDNGLEFDKELLVHCDLTPEGAAKAVRQLIEAQNRPDAIFCVNDTVAYVVVKELKKVGLRIPQDVAVTGFNNEFHSTIVEPPLTTVWHPTFEMGEETARLLISQIEGTQPHSPRQIVMKTRLIVRDSSLKNAENLQ
jgi:LacI family transcriptional regulator